jgi:hypothetical protein
MKRWLILFAIVAVMTGAAAVVSYKLQVPLRERARFDQIKPGMTREFVFSVMGKECYQEADLGPDAVFNEGEDRVRWFAQWRSRYRPQKYGVSFTPEGKVFETWILDLEPGEE